MAVAASIPYVRGDPIALLKALHFVAQGNNRANRLVARDKGELGDELSLVDVLVGTANTADVYFEQDLFGTNLRDGDLLELKVKRLVVPQSIHFLFDDHDASRAQLVL